MGMARAWVVAAIVSAAGVNAAAAESPLFDFPNDLAFRRDAVDAFAGRMYAARLAKLREGNRLDRDPALLARLEAILARLRTAARIERPGLAGLDWEIHTCRRCDENASAMAGGRLMIGEEFVAKLEPSDDELAFLLAHEMAHVLAEHTREFATAARYFMDNGLHRPYWDIQSELDSNLAVQLRMAFVAEQQELDADRIGFFLGARAGFDPPAMLSLLRKLGPGSSDVLSTHPTQRLRLDQATAMLQAAEVVRGWSIRGAPRAASSK
jgi:predicted Zn-dependent protease